MLVINHIMLVTIKKTCAYSMNYSIVRFILTFMMLHTFSYLASVSYSFWCLDTGVFGYFNNIIDGNGPVCYMLLSTSYHAQTNIYQLVGLSFVSTGFTWISNSIMKGNRS